MTTMLTRFMVLLYWKKTTLMHRHVMIATEIMGLLHQILVPSNRFVVVAMLKIWISFRRVNSMPYLQKKAYLSVKVVMGITKY